MKAFRLFIPLFFVVCLNSACGLLFPEDKSGNATDIPLSSVALKVNCQGFDDLNGSSLYGVIEDNQHRYVAQLFFNIENGKCEHELPDVNGGMYANQEYTLYYLASTGDNPTCTKLGEANASKQWALPFKAAPGENSETAELTLQYSSQYTDICEVFTSLWVN